MHDFHEVLRSRFGFPAFRDGQAEAIQAALEGKRVLLVQPTGWGKSLVYQMIAALRGLTLVFSPLRALMRDQVRQANERFGLRADTVNSDMDESAQRVALERAARGDLDLLYIAPERLQNSLWQEFQSRLPIRAVVIDEAHCVSMWGHDFRPEYRRIVNLVRLLPGEVPVVAVTATATPRVEQDVRTQIGEPFLLLRGNLMRPNLHLRVIMTESEAHKLAWLAHLLRILPGSGLIYTATRHSSEIVAQFLQMHGFPVRYYHAGLADERPELEHQLITNQLKALAATNALGMGLDKPDLRFVIHYETPGSPLHYYQEIGRAGRDGQVSYCILLAHPDDLETQRALIQSNRPPREQYQRIYSLLQNRPMRERELMLETGYAQTTTRTILYDLQDQGAITRDTQRYYRAVSNQPLQFDNYDALYEAKLTELQSIADYWHTRECRMLYLCRFLGDTQTRACGACDVCTGNRLPQPDEALIRAAEAFAFHPPLNIGAVYKGEPVYAGGIALSFYGRTPVGEAIRQCKYGAPKMPFPDWLVDASAALIRQSFPTAELHGVVPIPSTISSSLVEDFAVRLAGRLGIPIRCVLQKTRTTLPQKDFTNTVQKIQNIEGAFVATQTVPQKNLLVVDDVFDSGATLKEAGKILKQAGAGRLYAYCIARTRHRGDL
ncbi:MAG: RecQ family ATP-dependent DNA helicase [Armatimonadetes bacterium JP3_11]|jgi:ATP-dependent DNA helicase RecQ|nr:MAG: RecQ family ATP-dependent DNA helicase [Armatimonadetes bacterium JP3_11]RMH08433.1 MAG: RecQ family ATP-dependent DNA helicase [Armatimonadota bacterium]